MITRTCRQSDAEGSSTRGIPKREITAVRFLAGLLGLVFLASLGFAETPTPKDPGKWTTIGKYVTARQAYRMWKADPERVKIIDCRTREEYLISGHPTMAYSIPAHLRTRGGGLRDNPEFEARVRQRFSPTDVILAICRAGFRSAEAVNRLGKAGFRNAYNIVDGFEGTGDAAQEGSSEGKQAAGGWKNEGAPWTYDINPDLL